MAAIKASQTGRAQSAGGGVGGISPIILYLILTVLFCSIQYGLIAYTGELAGGRAGYVIGLMWGPALAGIVTVQLKGLPWSSLGFAWRDTNAAWLGYLIPIAYSAIAYIIVWVTGMGGFAEPERIALIGKSLHWNFSDPALFVPLYFVFAGVTGIIANVAYGLGEELGWRGFLQPHLFEKFGYTRGTLIMGVIWAAWHVPLILFADYNSGTPSAYALTCFFLMVTNMSFIMTWLRLRSGSVWPCAILHGSHNLFIQEIFSPLTSAKGSVTAYAIDEFGFMIPVITFLFALWLWFKRDVAINAWEAQKAAAR